MRVFVAGFILLWSCWSGTRANQAGVEVNPKPDTIAVVEYVVPAPALRDSSYFLLKQKLKSKKPLVVHVMVPLCDNEHQGIVPVNKQLGNGMNLQTNLYWGAGYGVRSYFKKLPEWKIVSDKKPLDSTVLERVVFKRTYANGAKVYIVADAYRGDAMKQCVRDFLVSVSGRKNDVYKVDSTLNLPVYGNADLLVFNGHDGLMDDSMKFYYNEDRRVRECALIACYSYDYFEPYLIRANAYPIITTTGLLAPEAYAMGGLIDSWAALKSGAEIRQAVASAYLSKHPSSGMRGCLGLFRSGWKGK